ncbi:MAG: hypothetical protein AAB354_11115 [candidate division KSB1 bacterium]
MPQSVNKALETLQRYESLYSKRIIKIIGAANQHILMHLGDGMAAGKPVPVNMNGRRIWNLAIVLAAKAGGPAEVGAVLVDDESLEIVGATESKQVLRNVKASSHAKLALA